MIKKNCEHGLKLNDCKSCVIDCIVKTATGEREEYDKQKIKDGYCVNLKGLCESENCFCKSELK